MNSYNSFWSVPPKVSVDTWVGDAIVEAVDNVLLQDIQNSGTHVEETTCVGPEELVAFLFTLSKIMASTCTGDRPWKLSMKTFLSRSQESIELLLRLSNHVSGAGSKTIGK
jgi:hypothetical protein